MQRAFPVRLLQAGTQLGGSERLGSLRCRVGGRTVILGEQASGRWVRARNDGASNPASPEVCRALKGGSRRACTWFWSL